MGSQMSGSNGPSTLGTGRGLHRTGWLLFVLDIVAAFASAIIVLCIRFDTPDLTIAVLPYLPAALLPFAVRPLVHIAFGLYRREWRHASVRDLFDLVKAVMVGSVLILVGYAILVALSAPGTSPFPRSFFILEPVFFLALTAGVRLLVRATMDGPQCDRCRSVGRFRPSSTVPETRARRSAAS